MVWFSLSFPGQAIPASSDLTFNSTHSQFNFFDTDMFSNVHDLHVNDLLVNCFDNSLGFKRPWIANGVNDNLLSFK